MCRGQGHLDATIVIPCKAIEAQALQCALECRRVAPGAYVILLPNSASPAEVPPTLSQDPMVRIEPTGDIWIGAKRNLGSRLADTTYLCFIDSDAYPQSGWPHVAVAHLERNPETGAVGGPNISPPCQKGMRLHVGNALRSKLVSGPWAYRKITGGKAFHCEHVPSCNMVVRRADYLAVEGMDETLVTAEDVDFTKRIREKLGKKIYFHPQSVVFHIDRTMHNFIIQRMCFGASLLDISLGTLISQRQFLGFAPLAFILAVTTLFALGFFATPFFSAATILLVFHGAACALEASRHASAPREIPMTFIAIWVGNLFPGVGVIARIAGILPDRKVMYRNYDTNDAHNQ